ncbi:hypothetical protein EV424DRAFT_1543645 [Suillus variegatus]|nr:hypothetical protein EV424DRAFT_1543645 [Suillus variegatus]
MISNLNNRLSSLLLPSTISRKGALALSSSTAEVDGLKWWIDCQSNPMLQFELRLLLFLLEGHVYSAGDLWCLVMARQIEVMQEERFKLYKIQPQNHTSSNHLAMELEFLEDKRDRAQLELSLYSQAMDVFQPHLGYTLSLGLMGACRAISQDKWLSGMATGVSGDTSPAIGDVTDESTSVTSKLLTIYKMLVLPEIACRPYGMVSTWVEECIEEYYMDDRAMEGASLQILISQASDLSNPEAEGKKRLFSALNKAKDLLGSVKRARTRLGDRGGSSHPISPDTRPTSPALDLLVTGNDAPRVDIISTSESLLTEEITASASLSVSGQEDLPLAQRRTRRQDIQLPRRYRQFEDILPQPLPSVPTNHINQSSDSPPPPHTQSSGALPPFRTPRNIFGLLRQFFSPNPPSHDPKEVITLEDISAIPGSRRERLPLNGETPTLDEASPYYPYFNRSSLELGDWYWNGGAQKSQQSFNDLIDIVTDSNFDRDGVRATPWRKINLTLGQNDYKEGNEEWEDEDAGWHKTQVSIQVPIARTNEQAGVQTYSGVDLYHRSLVSVIREKLLSARDDELFHYEPYKLLWQSDHLQREVKIQGELYQSPAFMDAHQKLQESPRELDCDLPRMIVSLMFWSDATHLTSFGNAKLWPVYLYFGNESKYCHCKPSCHLSNHVAYFQKLPDSFKDFTCEHTEGKGVGRECTTHCQRELFQAQWGVLLNNEFLEAYVHGIVIECCDGIKRRFYPRIFTYSADYPEKVLVATIRQLGGCPCPRCLIPKNRLHNLGMPHDGQQRITLLRSSEERDQLVTTARKIIYDKNYGVDSTAVENILKPCSWVPTCNVLSNRLCPHGFNVFEALVVDLLHEVELGIWRSLLVHLLRIIRSVNKDLVHELDQQYRLVPPFGQSTIRRFTANTSDLSNMAARNFEDLLQCAIPVFDGLLPNNNHNKIIQDLLFTLAHWHGLAKLRMHSDLMLEILDTTTVDLGNLFRRFKEVVCASYDARELDREVNARSRRQAKEATRRSQVDKGKKTASQAEKVTLTADKPLRRKVSFNLQTYKFHALGDYVSCIRHFGTTDSYSTEPGELEHCTGKGRYLRTDRKSFIRQLTHIKRRQTRIRRIKSRLQQTQSGDAADITTSNSSVHHHIGQSEKTHDDIGSYLRAREGDPAIKNYFSCLRDHLLSRIQLSQSGQEAEGDIANVLFK